MSSKSSLDELTSVVVRVRGMLLSEQEAEAAVIALARVAQHIISSAIGAGVSLFDLDGRQVSAASTDNLVEIADAVQYRLGEGPCLTAWARQELQRIDDTLEDPRWARWQAAAAEAGIRSVLSTPLTYRAESLGALKVYARSPAAFTQSDETLLAELAEAAATLLGVAQPMEAPARLSSSLQAALGSRETIALAAGIVMARDQVTVDTARAVLAERARLDGRRMVEIAAEVLEREQTRPR